MKEMVVLYSQDVYASIRLDSIVITCHEVHANGDDNKQSMTLNETFSSPSDRSVIDSRELYGKDRTFRNLG